MRLVCSLALLIGTRAMPAAMLSSRFLSPIILSAGSNENGTGTSANNTKNTTGYCDSNGDCVRYPSCSERRPERMMQQNGIHTCRNEDGALVNTGTPPSYNYAADFPDGSYTVRTDCGAGAYPDMDPSRMGPLAVRNTSRPLVEYNSNPSPTGMPPKYGEPTWMSAFCALNFQKSAADAEANHNYYYYATSFSTNPGYEYDYYYCKYNGWLEPEAVALKRNYSALYDYSLSFCESYAAKGIDISSISMDDFTARYNQMGSPNAEQANWMGAWACAMGGPASDISYCAHTYRDLSFTAPSTWPATKLRLPMRGVSHGVERDGNATDAPAFCMYPDWQGQTNPAWDGTAEDAHVNNTKEMRELWKCPPDPSYGYPL